MNRETLFSLKGISKNFLVGDVVVQALTSVSLDIGAGEYIALMGASGSGKSTLLNLLGLIETPSSGSLSFTGNDMNSCSEYARTEVRRKDMGFIFQNFNLLPILSAAENVEYPLNLEQGLKVHEIHEKAVETLKKVGIGAFVDHRPSQLSGGQRQRVAVARALVKNPKVILADEPTANLDSKTAIQIAELLGEIKDTFKTTVIVATHDKKIADRADRVIYIKDGRIQPGPPAE